MLLNKHIIKYQQFYLVNWTLFSNRKDFDCDMYPNLYCNTTNGPLCPSFCSSNSKCMKSADPRVQNYRTLKNRTFDKCVGILKQNIRAERVFSFRLRETPIEIASGLAEAIFTCQTGECTDALGKNLEAWSGVSWWKKMFPKAVLTPRYLQTLHALASCFSFGSFGFLSLTFCTLLRKSWILHSKIYFEFAYVYKTRQIQVWQHGLFQFSQFTEFCYFLLSDVDLFLSFFNNFCTIKLCEASGGSSLFSQKTQFFFFLHDLHWKLLIAFRVWKQQLPFER